MVPVACRGSIVTDSLTQLFPEIGGSACESNTPLPIRTTAGFEDWEDHRIPSASVMEDRNAAVNARMLAFDDTNFNHTVPRSYALHGHEL